MPGLLVCLILLIQGIPVQRGGTVTGVLRDSQGNHVPGVRMGAVARPDAIEQAPSGGAMAGLAETDQQGRFTLENIPPGTYYIAAGRLDLQTYYPGTQNMADATAVTIVAGAAVSNVNFILNSTSLGRSNSGLQTTQTLSATVPVRVAMEGGGKLPVSADGKLVLVRLQPNAGNSQAIPIDGSAFTVGPAGDFRVSVENLPQNYAVKSILYGATDVTQGWFRLTAANFPIVNTTIFSPPPPPPPPQGPAAA